MTTFRGPFADVEIPTTPLPDFVLEHAAARADRPALIDGPSGRTLTYGALASGVQALASGLAERGFAPGEVVALFAPNLPEYAVAFHGVLAAGGANTTINSLAAEEDIRAQLVATRARYLITIAPFLERALPAAEAAGVERVFLLGAEGVEGTESFASLLAPGRGTGSAGRGGYGDRRCRAADVERHDGLRQGGAADAAQPGRQRRCSPTRRSTSPRTT